MRSKPKRLRLVQSRLVRWCLLTGLLLATSGVGLVVKGEIDRARDDARFREAQAALKAGIAAVAGPPGVSPSADSNNDVQRSGATPGVFEDVRAIARIKIPAISLDVAVVRYNNFSDLEIGLGWMTGSKSLNEVGSAVVLGHRTLFGAPLRDLDKVSQGDIIQVTLKDGSESTYVVNQKEIRRPSDSYTDLVERVEVPRLLLVTCHPEDSTEFRLLVVADVVART